MAKMAAPATQGYSMKAPGAGKKVLKSMSLSMQGPQVKATHSFIDPMHDQEHYMFGEGEGKGLMNHISKHLNVKLSGKKMAPEGPEEANSSSVHEAEKAEE